MATRVVKIAERKVWVDDQPISLLSGEMHYWRLDPNSWRDCLRRIREMGIDIVATYACWDFHQIAPGEYDFAGETDPSYPAKLADRIEQLIAAGADFGHRPECVALAREHFEYDRLAPRGAAGGRSRSRPRRRSAR